MVVRLPTTEAPALAARPSRRRQLLRTITLRLLFIPVALLVAATGSFFLVNAIPSNPGAIIAGASASDEQVEQINASLGLDRPLLERYGDFLGDALHLDLGRSYFTGKSVTEEIRYFLPSTLVLVVAGVVVAITVGRTLGLLGAFARWSPVRRAARGLTSLTQASPDFLIGLTLIIVFYSTLSWAPAPTGQLDIGVRPPERITGAAAVDAILAGDLQVLRNAVGHLILPALALGLHYLAYFSNGTRLISDRVLRSKSTEFALATGLSRRRIARRTLRHSRTERITYAGLLAAGLVGGTALVEKGFSWSGYSAYVVDETLRANVPVVQGFVFVSASITVLIFFLVDIVTRITDPRLEAAESSALRAERARRRWFGARVERWDDIGDLGAHHADAPVPGRLRIWATQLVDAVRVDRSRDDRGVPARAWAWAKRWRRALVPAGYLAVLVLLAFTNWFEELATRAEPFEVLRSPGAGHWFGTDSVGRDVLARSIEAAGTDIPLAAAGVLGSFVLGVPLGLLASEERRSSTVIMRALDIFQALPLIVIAIAVVVLTGNHVGNVVPAIMLFGTPQFIRITRAAAQTVRSRRYVDAAESFGAGRWWLLRKEIYPNITSSLLAQASLTAAASVSAIAALSFLGVGIQPSTPSWGSMLRAGSDNVVTGEWWTVVAPGVVLVSVVSCLNAIGNRVNAVRGLG